MTFDSGPSEPPADKLLIELCAANCRPSAIGQRFCKAGMTGWHDAVAEGFCFLVSGCLVLAVCKDDRDSAQMNEMNQMIETTGDHAPGPVSQLVFRTPEPKDGVAVWRSARAVGTLELNTAYFYLVFCSDFQRTCVLAEDGDSIAGFVIGYQPPDESDTAFCWQIGVLPRWRGQGLGKRLLAAWLDLPSNRSVRWLTATVADDNQGSDALFKSFASSLGVPCTISPHFVRDHFPAGHRPEPLYRIGPITGDARSRI